MDEKQQDFRLTLAKEIQLYWKRKYNGKAGYEDVILHGSLFYGLATNKSDVDLSFSQKFSADELTNNLTEFFQSKNLGTNIVVYETQKANFHILKIARVHFSSSSNIPWHIDCSLGRPDAYNRRYELLKFLSSTPLYYEILSDCKKKGKWGKACLSNFTLMWILYGWRFFSPNIEINVVHFLKFLRYDLLGHTLYIDGSKCYSATTSQNTCAQLFVDGTKLIMSPKKYGKSIIKLLSDFSISSTVILAPVTIKKTPTYSSQYEAERQARLERFLAW